MLSSVAVSLAALHGLVPASAVLCLALPLEASIPLQAYAPSSTRSYGWDEDGNQTLFQEGSNLRTMTWDAGNRLVCFMRSNAWNDVRLLSPRFGLLLLDEFDAVGG